MIDLNNAEEQREGTGGGKAVPPDSIVLVQMHIRQPVTGKEGSDPLLTRAHSSLEYLNCEFVVAQGSYQGAKFWNNLNVQGASTAGQKTAVDISMRTIRAMVEASRGVNPRDASPQASQQRVLQSWDELNGLYFPAMLDCEISEPNKDGKRFVNNKLKRVVTPDRQEYAIICDGGEIITDRPLPQIPDGAPATKTGPLPQPGATHHHHASTPAAPVPPAPQAPAGPRPAPNWAAPTPPPAGDAPY